MRLRELLDHSEGAGRRLAEGRDAPLYHQIHLEKAQQVFADDALVARREPQSLWVHQSSSDDPRWYDQPYRKMGHDGGMQALYGNSFTRNKRLDLTRGGGYGRKILSLEVDQARVAQTNRIVPLNATLSVYHFSADTSGLNDRNYARPGRDYDVFAEEFVMGELRPLHRYLTRIIILFDRDDITKYKLKQVRSTGVVAYAAHFGIPLVWKDGTPGPK